MSQGIEQRLRGTRRGHVVQELFANSAHFPLANIFLELLVEGPSRYLLELDLYIILAACLIQAWFLGSWSHAGRPRPLIGNLIGPAIYTLVEAPISEGFFTAPHHLAYWGFAITIGLLQQGRVSLPPTIHGPLLLAEHLVRTAILLVMYVILELLLTNEYDATTFFDDPSHIFVAVVVPALGVVIGFASLNAERYLTVLRATAGELNKYSEWLLGRDLLSRAVDRPEELSLQRRERSVLFMDIRGFTAWSERRGPEEVVEMVNAFYEGCERVWGPTQPVKVKHTADELMLVYADAAEALAAGRALLAETAPLLAEHQLAAGVGIHSGPLVEGLIGSGSLKNFDVLGDTANTAKRLCSAAKGGWILLSDPLLQSLDSKPATRPCTLKAKGKEERLKIHLLV